MPQWKFSICQYNIFISACKYSWLPTNYHKLFTDKSSEIDTDILAIVRDVFRAVEKDNGDGTQRGKDSLEASQKVLELVTVTKIL